jgi:hypothetical protein
MIQSQPLPEFNPCSPPTQNLTYNQQTSRRGGNSSEFTVEYLPVEYLPVEYLPVEYLLLRLEPWPTWSACGLTVSSRRMDWLSMRTWGGRLIYSLEAQLAREAYRTQTFPLDHTYARNGP